MRAVFSGAVACAAGFFVASRGVGSKSGLSRLDAGVWSFFAEDSNVFLESLARWVTRLGAGVPLVVMALATGAILWAWRRSVALAVAPWIAVQVTMLVVGLAKAHFAVDRPPSGYRVVDSPSPAFPSGHAGNSAAWATATVLVVGMTASSRAVRSICALVASVLVLAVAWSRLELNVHWFSDVVGGILLGGAIGGFAAGLCLRVVPGSMGATDRPVSVGSDLDA